MRRRVIVLQKDTPGQIFSSAFPTVSAPVRAAAEGDDSRVEFSPIGGFVEGMPYPRTIALGLAALFLGAGLSSMSASPSDSTPSTPSAPAEAPKKSRWPAEELKLMTDKYGELQETESGLLYRIIREGDAATKARKGQRVSTHYTGTFPDGKVFDSSVKRGQPFAFTAGVKQVIPAWDEAILAMGKGEKRLIVVPSYLGYGSRGAGGVIPPNATLVFEMELLDIVGP
jgi:peptidylprolyl isomerase